MAETPAPSRSRQPDIEAFRALAAVMVVVAHLPWYQYFPGGVWPSAPRWLAYRAPLLGIGGLAVVIFLVISGAGLCRLLVLKAPSAGSYLRKRLGRLFGFYWAAAVPIAVVAFAIGWQPLSQAVNVLLVLLGLGFVSKASWAALFPSWWYMAIAWQVVLAVPADGLGDAPHQTGRRPRLDRRRRDRGVLPGASGRHAVRRREVADRRPGARGARGRLPGVRALA